jgi:hypothetical protein
LLSPTAPIFKVSLKNPCFLDFLSFFPHFGFVLFAGYLPGSVFLGSGPSKGSGAVRLRPSLVVP